MSHMARQEASPHPEHAGEDLSHSHSLLPSLALNEMYAHNPEAYGDNELQQPDEAQQTVEVPRTTAKASAEAVDQWEGNGIFSNVNRTTLKDVGVKSECLRTFWKHQVEEVQAMSLPRVQPLPPKRIRRIIKYDEDVQNATQRVSKEVVELFGKAAELFIAELSLVSWMNVAPSKKIVQVNHISSAVAEYHTYDFLSGIVPEPKQKPKRTRKRATTTSNQDVDPVEDPSAHALASSAPNFDPAVTTNNSNDEGGPLSSDLSSSAPLPSHLSDDDLHTLSSHEPIRAVSPIHFPSNLYDIPVQSPLSSIPAPSRANFSSMSIESSSMPPDM